MASKERESTGMTLISSMYSDDEDDEMEDVPDRSTTREQGDEYREAQPTAEEDSTMLNDEEMLDSGRERDATPLASSGAPQFKSQRLTPKPTGSPSQEEAVAVDYLKHGKARLAIVEYGQDEVAMSPEAEDGEMRGTAGIVGSEELQIQNSEIQGNFVSETRQVLKVSSQENVHLSAQLNSAFSDKLNNAVCEAEFAHVEVVTVEVQAEVDPLSKFLPLPPLTKCSDELQRRINKFLELKRGGKSYNAEVRNKKEYRNPDFLVHAVTYQDIDPIGSCFSKDVFDPHGYDKSDFYDEIEADMKRDMERKEQERKKSQKIEYVSGGVQLGIVTTTPKVSVPSIAAVGAAGLPSIPASSTDGVGRDGRQSKKSKWDKVDSERRNPLLPPGGGGQDPFATVTGAHSTLLSSANTGSGYTAFAQQRRKEAEEKRPSDRRERRT